MPSKPNTSGLKRGGITPEAQKKGLEAMQRANARRKDLLDKSRTDPYAAYLDMHEQMTKHILKLLKEEAKEGGAPVSSITDRLREYRQLTSELNDYLERRGELDAAAAMFAHLEERLAQANESEESPDAPGPEGDESSEVEAGTAAADMGSGKS